MSIRKQTIWNPEQDQYAGFAKYGEEFPENSDTFSFRSTGFSLSWHTKSLEMPSWLLSY